VNVVPSERMKKDTLFIQGMEKFIDTMKGTEYTCEILATPLAETIVKERLAGFEKLYSAIFPFSKRSSSHAHNRGESFTAGVTDSISKTISDGITKASGKNDSHNYGKNSGMSIGAHMLLNFGVMSGNSEGWGNGNSSSESTSNTRSDSRTYGLQKSKTTVEGSTDNLTIEYRNKEIEDLLEKIDRHIKRLKDGMSYGMWESSVFFIAKEKKVAAMAASTYRSLLLGDDTGIENSYFTLFGDDSDKTRTIVETLKFFEKPRFIVPSKELYKDNEEASVFEPNCYINGKELALLINLPRKSVNGVIVSKIAEFGRNVLDKNKRVERNINIGSIYHMGKEESAAVNLNMDSLTSHCFVTGSTGSGKSNTIYKLIESIGTDVPFLVIEPAKGEYRNEFRGMDGINLFSTHPLIDQMLKLNPFAFDTRIHILEHLDRIVEVFNGCWEMYAAMPAILKEAIEEAYVSKGWDLLNSVFMEEGEVIFPTFIDVLNELPKIINTSQYSADTKGDYIGALVTRVNSMTNGIYGQIFCGDFEVENSVLFDEKTIIDLSRVGSTETKSLIMGILILKLNEYRMATAKKGNENLKHITVLEEAHNLLKNSDNIKGTAGNSVVAKSVEMIVNSIAEMRTYGEGFVIVDQSPTAVDIAAIKNTNTKIIMRLPEQGDCKLAGNAVSLNDEQIRELAKLETGTAVIMQNGWEEPVLTKISKAEHTYERVETSVQFKDYRKFQNNIIEQLILEYEKTENHNIEAIFHLIDSYNIISSKKIEMKRIVKRFDNIMRKQFDSILFGRTMLRLTGCNDAFKKAEKFLHYMDGDEKKFTEDSIRNWYVYTESVLRKYVLLSEENQDIIRQYILHAKKFENHEISYSCLYTQIYGEIR
jgi:DNA helicase HerA-like ATPase